MASPAPILGHIFRGVAMSRYAIFEAARFMLCCALAGSAVGFLVGLMRGER